MRNFIQRQNGSDKPEKRQRRTTGAKLIRLKVNYIVLYKQYLGKITKNNFISLVYLLKDPN